MPFDCMAGGKTGYGPSKKSGDGGVSFIGILLHLGNATISFWAKEHTRGGSPFSHNFLIFCKKIVASVFLPVIVLSFHAQYSLRGAVGKTRIPACLERQLRFLTKETGP